MKFTIKNDTNQYAGIYGVFYHKLLLFPSRKRHPEPPLDILAAMAGRSPAAVRLYYLDNKPAMACLTTRESFHARFVVPQIATIRQEHTTLL